MPENKE